MSGELESIDFQWRLKELGQGTKDLRLVLSVNSYQTPDLQRKYLYGNYMKNT